MKKILIKYLKHHEYVCINIFNEKIEETTNK